MPIYYGSAPFALKRGSQALNLYYGSTLISGGAISTAIATISTEAQTVPSWYIGGSPGYYPVSAGQAGYSGISTYEGYEGHGVAFSGWSSTGFIVRYRWDFGVGTESDYGGRYFDGMNAGHVYETAGTYTVTLTVTDYLGGTSAATSTVVIHAAGAGNTSIYGSYALTTYYVDATNGNDSWDGKASAFVSGVNGPWKTVDKVLTVLQKSNGSAISGWTIKPGDKILFKRGETFPVNNGKTWGPGSLSSGVHIGAYGAGAKPKWKYTIPAGVLAWAATTSYTVGQYVISPSTSGSICYKVTTAYTSGASFGQTDTDNCTSGYLFDMGVGSAFMSFLDIEFNLFDTSSRLVGIHNSSNSARNWVFCRCDIFDAYNAPLSFQNPATTELVSDPYGVFILGCSANQLNTYDTAIVTLLFGGMGGLVLVGSTVDCGGNHLVYTKNLRHSIVADNTFSRPAFGRTAFRMAGGPLGAKARRVHFTRNKFLGWKDPINGTGAHNGGGTRYNYALLNISPNGELDLHIQDVVFDRNIATNYEWGLLVSNANGTKVFNNIFATPAPTARHLIIGGDSPTESQATTNVDIFNNTFVANGSTSDADNPLIYFHSYTAGTVSTNIRIKNNLALSVAGRDDTFFGFQRAEQPALIDSDYNLYQTSGTDFAKVVSTLYTPTTWRSTYTKDVNTLIGAAGFVLEPSAVTHTPGNPASSAAAVAEATDYITNLHLSGTSQAIGAGVDVSIWRDFADSVRAAPFDIGAFDGTASAGGSSGNDSSVFGEAPFGSATFGN